MSTVKLEDLSAEQREQLAQEALESEKKAREELASQREEFKKTEHETVEKYFAFLESVGGQLNDTKKQVLEEFEGLEELRNSLYSKKRTEQKSWSYSNEDASKTIQIGYNVYDGWDSTVTEGVAMVKEFLMSLVTDDRSRALINTALMYLKPDKEGMLKAKNVLELKKMKEDFKLAGFEGIDRLEEGIEVIELAYRPVRSSSYVRAFCRNEHGEKEHVNLSMTTK